MNIEKLFKILESSIPSKFIKENEKEIFSFIPELEICKGFKQNNDWHTYDVYEHILKVVDNIDLNIILRLAALFHDIAKPICYTEDENKVGHFYGHWVESQKIFLEFAKKHNLDKNMTFLISNLIYYHDINVFKLDDNEINNLYKIFGEDGINMLFNLKKADLLAQNPKYHYLLRDYEEIKNKILEDL